jgi:hypothetical protein
MDIGGLTEKIKKVPDPRRAWGNIRHKLEDIAVTGLAAFPCGGKILRIWSNSDCRGRSS